MSYFPGSPDDNQIRFVTLCWTSLTYNLLFIWPSKHICWYSIFMKPHLGVILPNNTAAQRRFWFQTQL